MRRIALAIGVLAVLLTLGRAAEAQTKLDADTVKSALRTAAPEEDGFIELVVAKVNDGTIPRPIFESTFQWARRKARHRFQYFRQALLIRLRRAGIRL